ncbi:MAG: DNA cytosine methyltransferase [Deltaproteobacteria bacterium]|jgi:DNA (cytosine-5)-methyltransferase 1|nr:DNA cytosine methyltransferase [Deltaproteobacteria bacterium]
MVFPVLSFFTGGGFLDLGFTQAEFSVCWTNENCPAFIDGYGAGMSAWFSSLGMQYTTNIAISNSSNICELSAKLVIKEAFCGLRPNIFGVIGGPPCPDFSNGGIHAGGDGTNGSLTTVFVDMLCALRPSFFVIENVPGLYRFHKHREFLKKKIHQLQRNGYAIDYNVLNALEFGVPQDRERLFVVGFKRSLAQNAISRKLAQDEHGWFPWPKETHAGAKQLPWPKSSPFGQEPSKPAEIPLKLTVYSALASNGDPEKLANGGEYFNPYSSKFLEIKEGDVSRKSFKRLHRYRFSPTAWYGNQEVHLHPWKARRLSVREALRIQSVPDEYILPGNISLSAKFKMICNGVPCIMAFNLASAVQCFLKQAIL